MNRQSQITPSEKLSSKTAAINKYRREAQALGIRSPYRQMVYIKAQLKKTPK